MLFIFDMGGVVTSTFEFEQIYKKLNISKEDFNNICSLDDDIWELFQKGKISATQFWELFTNRVGKMQHLIITGVHSDIQKYNFTSEEKIMKINTFDYDLFRLYFHPKLNTKTVEIINSLKKNHRVVCGTNTIQSHWENHLERGDYAFFDQTYASNKIGFTKPHKNFYEIIMEAEGYEAKETFFTDDRKENCQAAQELGINTVHFSSAEDLAEKWKKYF